MALCIDSVQLPVNETEGDGSRLTAENGKDFWTETISDEGKNNISGNQEWFR